MVVGEPGARSSILYSNVLPVLYPRVHCPRITHASAHYRAANTDLFVTPDFCWLMVAMAAQWIGDLISRDVGWNSNGGDSKVVS